jgi:hypothetical protein
MQNKNSLIWNWLGHVIIKSEDLQIVKLDIVNISQQSFSCQLLGEKHSDAISL